MNNPFRRSRPLGLTLRISEAPIPIDRRNIVSSREAAERIKDTIGKADRECFVILFLDVKNQLLGAELHSLGDATSSAIYPNQVMKSSLLHNAAALIFGHNHPSGDPEPSMADREITRRLVYAGRALGIMILDHIICTPGPDMFSFSDQGLIDECVQMAESYLA
jgi:DNA repair protein RadC